MNPYENIANQTQNSEKFSCITNIRKLSNNKEEPQLTIQYFNNSKRASTSSKSG